jgi:flap endonuclease-1
MGIKNLHTFLRKTCPDVYHEIPLHHYSFRTVAIDFSIYLCKFRSSYGDNWFRGFVHMMFMLRRNQIHPVLVFDSKPPPEKQKEHSIRSTNKRKNLERLILLEESFLHFKTHRDIINPDVFEPFLLRHDYDLSLCEQDLAKQKNTTIRIRPEDFDLAKQFLSLMNIPFCYGSGEAEAYCSFLNRTDAVSAVMTEDTDVLAYGAPVFLHRLDPKTETVMEVRVGEVCRSLGLNQSQFTDFCIMCGCDYNSNLPKIGPERSYRLLQKHGSIDAIGEMMDVQILNHVRIREIFRQENETTRGVRLCGVPDINSLTRFLFENNCAVSKEWIHDCLARNRFIRYVPDSPTPETDSGCPQNEQERVDLLSADTGMWQSRCSPSFGTSLLRRQRIVPRAGSPEIV